MNVTDKDRTTILADSAISSHPDVPALRSAPAQVGAGLDTMNYQLPLPQLSISYYMAMKLHQYLEGANLWDTLRYHLAELPNAEPIIDEPDSDIENADWWWNGDDARSLATTDSGTSSAGSWIDNEAEESAIEYQPSDEREEDVDYEHELTYYSSVLNLCQVLKFFHCWRTRQIWRTNFKVKL